MALVERMRAALPMRAVASVELRRMLQERSKRVFPRECCVTEVGYLGEEGGIVCTLDFDFSDTKNVHIVSITHFRFDRGNPLARGDRGLLQTSNQAAQEAPSWDGLDMTFWQSR